MNNVWLEGLSCDGCLDRRGNWRVGRVAVVSNEYPVVLPVNYRAMACGR